MGLSLDEIRKYVEKEGPKETANPNFSVMFWFANKVGLKTYGLEQRYFQRIDERIKEILPDEGQIRLSGTETTVIIYNEERKIWERANYDMMTGQPLPNGDPIGDGIIVPTSSIEVICFGGYNPLFKDPKNSLPWNPSERKIQAAGFLEKLLERSNGVTIIEVSQNTGDTYNRYFAVRNYRHRE